MDNFDLKTFSNLFKISSPLVLYLLLLILLRVLLEKLQFLNKPAFKNAYPLIKGLLHFFIFLICIVYALGALGIDIQGVIAGLGLFSFALSFSLKDAISNFISGLSILIYKPFNVGDHINIDEFSGQVEKVDIHYTIIKGNEEQYFIPNSYVVGAKIILKKPQT